MVEAHCLMKWIFRCKTGSFSSYGEACQLCPKGSISTKVGSKVCAQCKRLYFE